jgi:sulfatase maturation enzyme AslB (radical SAM superfamily)
MTEQEIKSSTICALPWVSMNSMPDGIVRVCCSVNDWDPKKAMGNIYNNTLEELVNSESASQIRKQMLAGEKPSMCSRCYGYEAVTGSSLRTFMTRELSNPDLDKVIQSTDANGKIDMNEYKLQYWDFRFSNTCNFGCRMCSPQNSSFIQIEQDKTAANIFTVKKNFDTWQKLADDRIDECKIIYFAGGEPLLMQEHWMILDRLVELKMFDVKLKYNINASKLSHGGKNIFDYWKQFDYVRVYSSIDDIGARAEYQRYGTDWPVMVENLHKINEYFGELTIAPAVTVFNALYLEELVEYMDANFTGVGIDVNYCFGPGQFNPYILPLELRNIIVEKIKRVMNTKYKNIKFVNRFDAVAKNIFDIKSLSGSKDGVLALRKLFIQKTEALDATRGQSFDETYPELAPWIRDPRFLTDESY